MVTLTPYDPEYYRDRYWQITARRVRRIMLLVGAHAATMITTFTMWLGHGYRPLYPYVIIGTFVLSIITLICLVAISHRGFGISLLNKLIDDGDIFESNAIRIMHDIGNPECDPITCQRKPEWLANLSRNILDIATISTIVVVGLLVIQLTLN